MRSLFSVPKISRLKKILDEYDLFIDGFYASINGRTPNLHQKTIADLLGRVKINLHSIGVLLNTLPDYSPTFFSIGLLNRTILADFISYCYLTGILLTGKDRNMAEQEIDLVLVNELNVLDKTYAKAMIAMVQLESELPNFNPNFVKALDGKDHLARLEKLKGMYKHLFEDNDVSKKLKSTAELRRTGSEKIFDRSQIKEDPKESVMHDFAVKHGFEKYAHTYLLFRFYSQFQHYSSQSMLLIRPEFNDYNFFYLIFTVNYSFILSDMIIQNLDSIDSGHLSRLREITSNLDDVLKT